MHDENQHCDFHRVYVRAAEAIYIRRLFERLRRYIYHCKFCLEKRTNKHAFYDQLTFIKIMTFFFHTITIDFIVALSISKSGMNATFIITDKIFKRVNAIFEKIT